MKRAACSILFGPLFVLVQACSPPHAHSVPGPEASDLIPKIRGMIVLDHPVGGISGIAFPSLATVEIRSSDAGHQPVHGLCGPALNGAVPFVERDMLSSRWALGVASSGGNDTIVFQDVGDPLWDGTVGEHLALAPDGKRIACVVRLKHIEGEMDFCLKEGEIEIWNCDTQSRRALGVNALDDVLCWLPDGSGVVFTSFVDPALGREVRSRHAIPGDAYGARELGWSRTPIVRLLDLESGRIRDLHAGLRPVLSPDGMHVVVRDFDLHWRILDLQTGTSRTFDAPGAIYPGAIAFVGPELVLYWAWPTAGTEAEWTRYNSPVSGPKQLRALKVVDLKDGRFQTAVSKVDPRRSVSFGP